MPFGPIAYRYFLSPGHSDSFFYVVSTLGSVSVVFFQHFGHHFFEKPFLFLSWHVQILVSSPPGLPPDSSKVVFGWWVVKSSLGPAFIVVGYRGLRQSVFGTQTHLHIIAVVSSL